MKKRLIVTVCFFLMAGGLWGCGGENGASSKNEAVLVTRTLKVNGMTCDGCEGAIQDAVGELPGVVAVEANHETATATVVFDQSMVSEQDVTGTIEGLGYSVSDSSPSS